jgi:hypothetical protein
MEESFFICRRSVVKPGVEKFTWISFPRSTAVRFVTGTGISGEGGATGPT